MWAEPAAGGLHRTGVGEGGKPRSWLLVLTLLVSPPLTSPGFSFRILVCAEDQLRYPLVD